MKLIHNFLCKWQLHHLIMWMDRRRENRIHHTHQMEHHFRNIVRKSSGVTKIKWCGLITARRSTIKCRYMYMYIAYINTGHKERKSLPIAHTHNIRKNSQVYWLQMQPNCCCCCWFMYVYARNLNKGQKNTYFFTIATVKSAIVWKFSRPTRMSIWYSFSHVVLFCTKSNV